MNAKKNIDLSAQKYKSPAPTDRTLDQWVYDSLFNDMTRGVLLPGEKLIEATLCEKFQVSRTIVRQALHRLAELKIVNIVPNKGASVAAPTPEQAIEVFEVRRGLEAAIIRQLSKKMSAMDLQRLQERLLAEQTALNEQDLPRWAILAGGFHLALAQMTGNKLFQKLLLELLTQCTLIVALYETPGNSDCEHAEHVRLVELLSLQDAEGAVKVMDQHLFELQNRLNFSKVHFTQLK
jgi:DNA-binding GntR family transcriptional regulator